uniref:Small ribosomal subunit protein uS11m n=1 Tax=Geotrypetes seraphini TaxID=260995 RepID=A0A6P8PL94_GEOSA|nr:28S ribosomal protein S11, mitochondrial isoform X2 [Geotrypetes seraphini]
MLCTAPKSLGEALKFAVFFIFVVVRGRFLRKPRWRKRGDPIGSSRSDLELGERTAERDAAGRSTAGYQQKAKCRGEKPPAHHASTGSCRGTLNVALERNIQTCVQRLQTSTEIAISTAETAQSQDIKEFSLFPPLPGQESFLKWGGKKFEEIPIAHIKATYNNTHINITGHENQPLARTSCGTEGFKNIKKSTGIAAQTAAISAASKAIDKGVSHVRVVVKGLGPGRLAAIKGLTMGGLEVISITDNTPIPHNGCRPRKARRM